MSSPTYRDIERLAYQGVRLEITGGRTTWEAYPGALHNGVVDDIRHNLTQDNLPTTTPCGCHHIADTYIDFGPNLLRRPDIAIFCAKPPRPDGAITGMIPGAIVEVISDGYEQKDRDVTALYLAVGVRDVVLVDPRAQTATWYQSGAVPQTLDLPTTLSLQMGCVLRIDRST
jgi:hypothetical protein